MSSSESNMWTLRSSDGAEFQITEAAAMLSTTIKNLIDDGCKKDVIPIHNVEGEVLAKVLEYCNKHQYVIDVNDKAKVAELRKWDRKFIKVDHPLLYELLLAANYLDIKGLLDLGVQTVSNKITGKTAEEIRTMFDIKYDFTPEDEAEMAKDNKWSFD
uniref:SKP1-like protein n=1 Tax=Lilium longiflorum TaxID=4690 RepID=C7SJ60_LILLO|nr:pollen specific SKP1-like protein LSK2 [Lilium longiflorum]